MEGIAIKLLEQLNSSVFVLIALLLVVFIMVYKAGALKEIFNHHNSRLDNVEKISDVVKELKTKVDLIYQYTNPNSPTRAQSPISLTVVGKEIIEKINADDIFKTHAVKLISLVEARHPKNAYDIQQISFEVAKKELINLLTEDQLKAVKEQAYNRGILVEDVLSVFGVLLRNKILENKNIPIAEVDKHSV